MTTIEERVQRGALLLDAEVPGWARRINEWELDLGQCDQCILGQLYGEYCTGRDALELRSPGPWFDKGAAVHGFHHTERREISIYDDGWEEALAQKTAAIDAEYSLLAAAWLLEIRARLTTYPAIDAPEPAALGLGLAVPMEVP
jgi:hypothetical protein